MIQKIGMTKNTQFVFYQCLELHLNKERKNYIATRKGKKESKLQGIHACNRTSNVWACLL